MRCIQFREVGFCICWIFVEVYEKEGNKVIWEALNECVVEEGVEHEELGLQGFDLILFDEMWSWMMRESAICAWFSRTTMDGLV